MSTMIAAKNITKGDRLSVLKNHVQGFMLVDVLSAGVRAGRVYIVVDFNDGPELRTFAPEDPVERFGVSGKTLAKRRTR